MCLDAAAVAVLGPAAAALRLVLDLLAAQRRWFANPQPIPRRAVVSAMDLVARHTRAVTEQAVRAAHDIAGLAACGIPRRLPLRHPRPPRPRPDTAGKFATSPKAGG
jgi:hypothetical protein